MQWLHQHGSFDETPTQWQINSTVRRIERHASWAKAFLLVLAFVFVVNMLEVVVIYVYFNPAFEFIEHAMRFLPGAYVLPILGVTIYVFLFFFGALLSIRLASNMNRFNFAMRSRAHYLKLQNKSENQDEEKKNMFSMLVRLEADSESKFPFAVGIVSILLAALLLNLFSIFYFVSIYQSLPLPGLKP